MLVIISIIILIVIVIELVNIIIGNKIYNKNKLSPYECGISPIGNNRTKLNIQYIIIAILYIIFDIEIILFIPYSMTQHIEYSYWIMIIILVILTIGYIYELRKGSLNWKGRLS